jgi:hypothetical protein
MHRKMILKVKSSHLQGISVSAQRSALWQHKLWEIYSHGSEEYLYSSAKLIHLDPSSQI